MWNKTQLWNTTALRAGIHAEPEAACWSTMSDMLEKDLRVRPLTFDVYNTAVNDVLQSREPLAAGNDDDDDDRLSLSFHSIDTIIGGVIAMCDRSCRSVVVSAPIVFPVALLQIFNCLSARCAFAASIIRRHHTHTMRDCIAVDDRRWLVLKSVHSSEVNVSNRAHRVNNRVFRPISRSKHYRSAGNIPPWIIAQTIPRSISSTLLQRMR